MYLPGCIRAVDVTPTVPVHERPHLVRAVLSSMSRQGRRRGECFALLPWNCSSGWAAQWLGPSGEEFPVHDTIQTRRWRGGLWAVTLGPVVRVKWPSPPPEGDSLLCLDTVTPVILKGLNNAKVSDLMVGAMHRAQQLSPPGGWPAGELPAPSARVLAWNMRQAECTGAHLSHEDGAIALEGRMVVVCNAQSRHLFELSARMGVGGSVSLGFGRVQVREAKP